MFATSPSVILLNKDPPNNRKRPPRRCDPVVHKQLARQELRCRRPIGGCLQLENRARDLVDRVSPNGTAVRQCYDGRGQPTTGGDRRCCTILIVGDSQCEFMRLEGMHDEALARPLPHDELVQLSSH